MSRIVVGVDSSPPSRAALAWAVGHAFDTASALHIIHVIEDHHDQRDDEGDAQLREAESLLEREGEFARAHGVAVSTELVSGDPFETLVAESRTAQLVVVGTHKTGFIQGHSIGSRFLGLTAMCLCPVAFIPSIPLNSRRGVLVAVDDSSTGRRAVRLAAAEAGRLHEELTLLYSAPPPGRLRGGDVGGLGASTALARAEASARTDSPGLAVRTKITRRGAARDLIDATLVASLVVLAHPDARRSVGSAAGALIHDVILNLGGPTIVIPGPGAGTAPDVDA